MTTKRKLELEVCPRYFLVLWQGSSDTDWVTWSGFYPTLILSKLCHGSFGDIEMSVWVILELMSTVCPSGTLGALSPYHLDYC